MIVQIKRGSGKPVYGNLTDVINKLNNNAPVDPKTIVEGQLAFDSEKNDLYIGSSKAIDTDHGAVDNDIYKNIVRIAGHTFFDEEFDISIRDRIDEITDEHLNYIYPLKNGVSDPLISTEFPAGRNPLWTYEHTKNIWLKYINAFNDKNREESLLSFKNWDSDGTPKTFNDLTVSGQSTSYNIKKSWDILYNTDPLLNKIGFTEKSTIYSDISGLIDNTYTPRNDFTNLVNYVSGFTHDIHLSGTIFDKIHKYFAYQEWPLQQYLNEMGAVDLLNKSYINQNEYGTEIFSTFEKDTTPNKQLITLKDDITTIESSRSSTGPGVDQKATSIEIDPDEILIKSTTKNGPVVKIDTTAGWMESNEADYSAENAVVINSQLEAIERYIKGTGTDYRDNNILNDFTKYESSPDWTINKRLVKHDDKISKLFSLATQSAFTPLKVNSFKNIPALPGSEMYNYNHYIDPSSTAPVDFRYKFDTFNPPSNFQHTPGKDEFGPQYKTETGKIIIGGDLYVSGVVTAENMWGFYENLTEYTELSNSALKDAIKYFFLGSSNFNKPIPKKQDVIFYRPMNGIQYMVSSFSGMKKPATPAKFWCLDYSKIKNNFEVTLRDTDSRLHTTLDQFYIEIKDIFDTIGGQGLSAEQIRDLITGNLIYWDYKQVWDDYQGKVWYNHTFLRNEETGRPTMFDWLWDFDQERVPDGVYTDYDNTGKLTIHRNFVLDEGTW